MRLLSLSRIHKRLLQITADSFLIVGSFILAMGLRYDSFFFLSDPRIWIAIGLTLPVTILVFAVTGFYRAVIRYISSRAFMTIGRGIAVSAVFLFIISQLLTLAVPRSVPGIYAMIALISVGGLRFFLRELFRHQLRRGLKPVLVYGAGRSGQQLVASLLRGNDYLPLALVDDNPALQGSEVNGLRVISAKEMPLLIENFGIDLALLAMPSAPRSLRREIIEHMAELDVRVRTVPNMEDIIAGKARMSDIIDVSEEDLLGRDPVAPVPELMSANVNGKVVMVTGAGGSIGSELCRQILREGPRDLILFEQSEVALYTIQMELQALAATLANVPRLHPVLGSVQSERRLRDTLARHTVDTVFHAAAYKHVPLVEENVAEGVRNNVFGTKTMLEAAIAAGVSSFTLISTDKAVRPTNIMGASKRLAEMVCQAFAEVQTDTRISMVRFGNVLGSSGSVIPLFRQQIQAGGPITVTHADITRYFMSIPEAAQLVIQASAMARGGDLFLLDMGQPVRILDLAMQMASLSGLRPYMEEDEGEDGDIAIRFTGLRPGEKLYEELLISADARPTAHPKIMSAHEDFFPLQRLTPLLVALDKATEDEDVAAVQDLMRRAGTGYSAKTVESKEPTMTGPTKLPSVAGG
ncbi:polysaccharide biosynthesis protein [Fuscovulum ytuae]|uniref:Nucleoside-diphosphate sugar epimerase/dehydratase n=1 Tax=Fuscovulum ytuae TaxID=3042299 RepID=A0ABY8Q3K5_9RHOB|nr:nucleoside-diphosphate sugar epimerase/dehydratase [Fuscovulum sp. YMD61]WGV15428.1 nucleoside-diphosphate sugar epimerase/dehydratase [Fuscovulum sp. YMD61]